VGLDFDVLYPPSAIDDRRPPERRPFPAGDVLHAIAAEALVVCTLARQLAAGRGLSDEDHARLVTASSRLLAAVEAAGLDTEGARLYRTLVKSRAARVDVERADAYPNG